MAIDILAKYGIKEVADVVFYELSEAGVPQYPVLYLDTLKVSTIEQTAESSDARGGKGNAALISWDYGKEINVTLEDALFSAKSMAIMFGNGTATEYNDRIMKTEQFICEDLGTATAIPTEAQKLIMVLVLVKLVDGIRAFLLLMERFMQKPILNFIMQKV